MNSQFPECNKCPKHYCCFNRPGAYAPEDFATTNQPPNFYEMREKLTPLLQEGTVVIDVWPGDPRREESDYTGASAERVFDKVYYIRPNTVQDPQPYILDSAMVPGNNSARCVFYDEGCSLPHTEQPMQCYLRVPSVPDYKCTHTYPRRQIIMDWLDYQPLLRALIQELTTKRTS